MKRSIKMSGAEQFEKTLIEGGYDPLIKEMAWKVKRQWDPDNRTGYDVEDLMQEAYLKIIEVMDSGRFSEGAKYGASMTTFMFTCARNRLIDIERANVTVKKRSKDIFVENIFKEVEKKQIEKNESPQQEPLERMLEDMSLRSLCDQLEKGCRRPDVFPKGDYPSAAQIFSILKGISEGRTRKELCDMEGISEARVKKIKKTVFELIRDIGSHVILQE